MLTQTDTKIERERLSLPAQAVALGREHHLRFKVLPIKGTLEESVEINGWSFTPRNMDPSPVPPEVDRHGQILKDAGFIILQEIIGHEPPSEVEEKPKIDYTKLKERASQVASLLGILVGVAITIAAGLAYAFAFALATDPVLIYVLEDGTWLIVGEYYD